jgi:hypothetical protein
VESSEDQATHAEWAAAQQLQELIQQGKAQELMEAYSDHMQGCYYVYGILQHLAYEVDSGIDPEVVNFARNLLDDWSK